MKVDFNISEGAPDVSYVELLPPGTDRRGIAAKCTMLIVPNGAGEVRLDFDKDGALIGVELLQFRYRHEMRMSEPAPSYKLRKLIAEALELLPSVVAGKVEASRNLTTDIAVCQGCGEVGNGKLVYKCGCGTEREIAVAPLGSALSDLE